MSKSFSTEYYNSIVNQKVLTLAECMRIELKNGQIYGFTNHTRNITFPEDPNVKYLAQGIVPTAFASSSSFAISNLNIELLIDDEIGIKRSDLEKNKFIDAKVEFFEINWMLKPYSLAHRDKILQGTLGEVKRTKSKFEVEFVSKTAKLQQVYTEKLKASCGNQFGDSRCKLDIEALGYTETATITERLNATELVLSSVSRDPTYFNWGIIEVLTGVGAGETLSIKNWDNDTKILKTQLAFVEVLSAGDTVKLTRGCDGIFTTCSDTYNNAKHFRGFPKVPGQDFMITGKGTGKV